MVDQRSIESIRFPTNLRVRSFLHSEADVGLHLHGAFELIVMLRGSLLLQTDRNSRILAPGDVGLVHSWQPHGTQRMNDSNRILVVQIDPSIANSDANFQYRRFTLPDRAKSPVQDELAAMAARLHLDTMQRRNGWPLQAESMALRILGHLSQIEGTTVIDRSEVMFGAQDYPEIGMALRRAMDFISANSHRPISLADVAAAQKTSANYLSRLFRSQAKTSFSHFLTHRRLVRAADRLRESQRTTVLAIAFDAGFPNIAAFNTAFRRSFGTTPTQWRKSMVPPLTRPAYPIPSDYEDIDKLSDLASRPL